MFVLNTGATLKAPRRGRVRPFFLGEGVVDMCARVCVGGGCGVGPYFTVSVCVRACEHRPSPSFVCQRRGPSVMLS